MPPRRCCQEMLLLAAFSYYFDACAMISMRHAPCRAFAAPPRCCRDAAMPVTLLMRLIFLRCQFQPTPIYAALLLRCF